MFTSIFPTNRFSDYSTAHEGRGVGNLNGLVRQSQNVLFSATSVFPFHISPDLLIIDENKVSIIHKRLGGAVQLHSVFVEDISDVTVQKNLILSTLKITDSTNPRFPVVHSVEKLKPSDAFSSRRIIQGLMCLKRTGVDLSNVNIKELTQKLDVLGKAKGAE
ncbi:hypothetical protein HY045_03545 [Candidatus Woesebacteria bacterium]|nr:hypothetical protein [Candidatus Woesebacteria bacterium]